MSVQSFERERERVSRVGEREEAVQHWPWSSVLLDSPEIRQGRFCSSEHSNCLHFTAAQSHLPTLEGGGGVETRGEGDGGREQNEGEVGERVKAPGWHLVVSNSVGIQRGEE